MTKLSGEQAIKSVAEAYVAMTNEAAKPSTEESLDEAKLPELDHSLRKKHANIHNTTPPTHQMTDYEGHMTLALSRHDSAKDWHDTAKRIASTQGEGSRNHKIALNLAKDHEREMRFHLKRAAQGKHLHDTQSALIKQHGGDKDVAKHNHPHAFLPSNP